MKLRCTTLICLMLGFLAFCGTGAAQMYIVIDLGTLGGSSSWSHAINATGQVTGYSYIADDTTHHHAFRTAPNSPINPLSDDLGLLDATTVKSTGDAINASGQVAGGAFCRNSGPPCRAFRTAPNSAIRPADDLGNLALGRSVYNAAYGIDDSGRVVGMSTGPSIQRAFRTAPNAPMNPATDDLGTLGGTSSVAWGINASGQVVGTSTTAGDTTSHGFRTAPNSPINPATDDLGTLGGTSSVAYGINALGQVIGYSNLTGDSTGHAFRTTPNRPIDPGTDDLGTLGGTYSLALAINSFGEVVGSSGTSSGPYDTHAFLYSGGVMHDLNDLIPADVGCELSDSRGVNDAGQIIANCLQVAVNHAFLLTPVYRAHVQQPIDADGSSSFNAKRGTIPVKFRLTQSDLPTCTLPTATISVTRISGGTFGLVDEAGIDQTGCQYHYNLAASRLGVGTYQVDINIEGIAVGHAAFALK